MTRLIVAFLASWGLGQFAQADEMAGPWNLSQLKNSVPQYRWINQSGPIQSLLYTGEVYQGRPTEVFAFYASPKTLNAELEHGKFPGVILIHGGGGTAFADWVYLWAKRGYAALAMDLAGSRPPEPHFKQRTGAPVGHQTDATLRTRLSNGGPMQGHPEKFDSIGGDVHDDWPFHAVANVIRAHTLLRSFSEVDAQRTAVTGISWGGYTTCLVASLDDRFRAAVPVYGCGFLHEGESVQKPSIDKLAERAQLWVQQYDPGSWLARCQVPIFFVNGTNDIHYPLDSYMKSFRKVTCPKQLRIEVNMRHGHPPGWAPPEIGFFIDQHCGQGAPLPALSAPALVGDRIQLACRNQVDLEKAELHYSLDNGLRSSRAWHTLPGEIDGALVTTPMPPQGVTTWFVAVHDRRGAMVSSEVQFGL